MIRKMFLAAALVATGSMFAQSQSSVEKEFVTYETSKHKVQTNKFWSNWFVTVGGGAQLMMSEHDTQLDFGKRISPALDVAVGKWFTPGIGLRLMYSGLSVKGATKTSYFVDGAIDNEYNKQKFNNMVLHGDIMLNLTNMFCGYNPKRVYNAIPYLSLGYDRVFDEPAHGEFALGLGLVNRFRLTKALDIQLDLRCMTVTEEWDMETGANTKMGKDGIFSATIGLTYNLPQRGWSKVKTPIYNDARWNAYRNQMEDLDEENARLKTLLAEANAKEVAPAPAKVAVPDLIVTFRIGKSSLTKQDRVNLGFLAKAIKEGDENASYTITGYADAGTGSKKINENLSKARAAAVYSCLVNEFGVNKNQIHVRHEGGVENMFYDDPRLSRAAILRNK